MNADGSIDVMWFVIGLIFAIILIASSTGGKGGRR